MTRALYSTDASIYQVEPIGVVLPKNEEDVIAVVETAARHGVPVLPRGGGTSLAGQAVGRAVVLDFSKYMRRVLEIDAEQGWVRTEPGIILDELNQHLAPHGVQFAPDPSTSNRGNVGGALGNNSCGAHSILWGKTVDNVAGLDVVLSDGSRASLGPLTREEVETRARAEGLEGGIYGRLAELGEAERDEVLARYPSIQRRVSGYNLDELIGDDGFDSARFVIGSEGTLVTITEARLKLVPLPRFKGLAVLHFRDVNESMEATVAALELKPAAVELVDEMIVRQARTNLAYSRMMDFVEGDPGALLLAEFYGESEAEVESKLDGIERRMAAGGLGYAVRRMSDPAQQARVWAVRKAGLGLMMNVTGDAKPLPFVEDTAVAPEHLPEYVRKFDEIVREHGTTAGYYGHASVGCLHIRPLIDLKQDDDIRRMESISEAVSDLVLEYGGALSGEHGDGLVRSMWNEKMFGPRIYEAFRSVKAAFDPQGIMNPGKIVDSPPMTNDLRYTPEYRTLQLRTGLGYAAEGSFAGAVEMCNGQGACRKVTSGTMCPSYMVTRDEEHSTRGRANALRAALSGALPVDSLTSRRLYDVLDLCLECKGCKAECPSNVDMAKLKYEFLDRYHKANGYPLRNRLFGSIAALGKAGSFMAPVSNWLLESEGGRDLLDRYAGIDRRRKLPSFASQTFEQWFRARNGHDATVGAGLKPARPRGAVVLLPDTFTNYNHPELGRAAVKVLERLRLLDRRPQDMACCGRPMLSAGMIDRARASAKPPTSMPSTRIRRAGRKGRRAGAKLPPHLPRRVQGPAGGRRPCLLDCGCVYADRRARSRGAGRRRRAKSHQRARQGPLPRTLPPEGPCGHGRRHGGAPLDPRVRSRGDRVGLLRHGGLIRHGEGALRRLHAHRRAGPLRPDPRRGRRRHHRKRGRLLQTADRRRHWRQRQAPRRSPGRRPLGRLPSFALSLSKGSALSLPKVRCSAGQP